MAGVPKMGKLPVVQRVISQKQVASYAHASGDHNPVHLDPEFASTSHFGGIVAHGMLTLAFVSQMLTRAFGQHWLESGALKVRFKGPAYLGDQVSTWGEVVRETEDVGGRRLECAVGLRNQKGEELISGTASVWLPEADESREGQRP